VIPTDPQAVATPPLPGTLRPTQSTVQNVGTIPQSAPADPPDGYPYYFPPAPINQPNPRPAGSYPPPNQSPILN
jgi:hypothetical protein